jgi:hypothetical protein
MILYAGVKVEFIQPLTTYFHPPNSGEWKRHLLHKTPKSVNAFGDSI